MVRLDFSTITYWIAALPSVVAARVLRIDPCEMLLKSRLAPRAPGLTRGLYVLLAAGLPSLTSFSVLS